MADNLENELKYHLEKSKANVSVDSLDELISGVLASPCKDGGVGETNKWMEMVSANLTPSLVHLLDKRLAQAERNYETGLITPCPSGARLRRLRTKLSQLKIGGFIAPLADEHQGEYVSKRAQRLAWLTGFTGSAGTAIILLNKAAIFVDGRYTLQAIEQVDETYFEIVLRKKDSLWRWITENISGHEVIGYDPWLHTANDVKYLNAGVKKNRVILKSLGTNPIDEIWTEQPAPPLAPIQVLNQKFSGQSSEDKRKKIGKILREADQDAVILTAPDSIAWLMNIRGGDIPYTPICLAFGILHQDNRFELYTDRRKIPGWIAKKLPDQIEVYDLDTFFHGLDRLGKSSAIVRIDPSSAADAICLRLKNSGANVQHEEDPCLLPKACKNKAELNGIRAAHIRDGLALTRFLSWLSREGTSGKVSELSAAERLEALRREGKNFQALSFPTISGTGPNGAIVHYRVTEKSNRPLDQNSLYLVDSGGQYLDGTTDVTRTIAIGTPSDEMKERFTCVLKGHIALATAIFPSGTSGSQLDVLARTALWRVGLDYDHGTGHGVGHYLGVHEGPQRISKAPDRVALRPGMIISNEPGYYEEGAYGIRIENLLVVNHAEHQPSVNREMLCFETLTLAPIDLNLVVIELLSCAEINWLNSYHEKVFRAHRAKLNKEDQNWLQSNTAPIS